MINEYDNPRERSKNFKKHRNEMRNFSIANFVKLVELIEDTKVSISNVVMFDEWVDEVDSILEPFKETISTLRTDKKCWNCSKPLYCSDLPQYAYVCPNCVENFG